MSELKLEVVAIGNALVDILAHATEEFIAGESEKHGMVKGGMVLIDDKRAKGLYEKMGQTTLVSGGSAANTMVGFASFGGKGGYMGKVAMDELGEVFRHDMSALGIKYETTPLVTGAYTGRCFILITPDAERTMNTYLGASVELSSDDVDEDLINAADIIYLEGYLFDKPFAKQAYYDASSIAEKAGKKVALTLSDAFCVDRHREDFHALVENHVNILFSNEEEILSLCQVVDVKEAVDYIRQRCELTVITQGARGSLIVTADEVIEVLAEPVDKVVDTTGAGDQYAAGFLYGYSQGKDLSECGRLGSLAASEVISHVGPRPELEYKEFLKKAS
jgi:sugar/nucleoside kinase (ribokinase family)